MCVCVCVCLCVCVCVCVCVIRPFCHVKSQNKFVLYYTTLYESSVYESSVRIKRPLYESSVQIGETATSGFVQHTGQGRP